MARLYCSVMTNLYASVSTAKPAPLVFYCITPNLKKFCARPFIQGLDTVATEKSARRTFTPGMSK